MNETLKVLETRRSCRKFKSDMLPEEDLSAIIRAGTFAPTGMNKQTPIIIAVTNKELRDKISEENRKDIGEIPEIYIKGLDFVYVRTIDEVIAYIFA